MIPTSSTWEAFGLKKSNNTMHILILPSWYKTEQNPVLGSFFEEQARALMRRGHQVGVLFPQFLPFSSSKKGFQRTWDDDGLPTLECYAKAPIPRSRAWNYRYLCQRAWRMFRGYVQEHGQPDLLHAHSIYYGAIVGKYLSEKSGIPIIHTEHRVDFEQTHLHPTDLRIAREVFLAMNQNLVVSSAFKADLPGQLNLPTEQFQVVHNMVDPMFLEEFSSKTFTPGETFRFFTTSFLSERKNHVLMLSAFAKFVETYPQAEFYIGGQNLLPNIDLRSRLEKLTQDLRISGKVHWLGHLSRKEVRDQMQACHAFLLGSTFETFGVVLIEAMAMGRPVISTDCKGPRDIITTANGIMVEENNIDAFAAAMQHLVKCYHTYDQQEISLDCSQKFGEAQIMSELESYYYRLLTATSSPS
jgi:glycosyltransferase involved in cell wall biosynthesis